VTLVRTALFPSLVATGLAFRLALATPSLLEPRVTPGLDVLAAEGGKSLRGQRIGLITNRSGQTIDGVPAARLLRDRLALRVVALFSPEHGYQGDAAAGDAVDPTRDPETDLPVLSLYGDTRAPTKEMLAGIDTLVFDIQDAGVRFFTYASTMKLAMEAAAASGIAFVVLDRPNPNGGSRVEGPVLDPAFESFVGIAPVPVLHGLTLGELARYFRAKDEELASLKLTVVPMRGWKREMLWADTGLPWRPPSPNLRTPTSAIAFPAFGLFEGVEASEGRGIETTFETVGAPWVEEGAYSRALTALRLPGVVFHPARFVPRSIPAAPHPRFEGELCRGVAVEIRNPRKFEAVRTGLTAIATLRSLFPESFRWVRNGDRYWIDVLLGTDRPRLALEAGVDVDDVLARDRSAVDRFLQERRGYLLY
jgi:uncharacterized protein YbbC (DUF1343 family)